MQMINSSVICTILFTCIHILSREHDTYHDMGEMHQWAFVLVTFLMRFLFWEEPYNDFSMKNPTGNFVLVTMILQKQIFVDIFSMNNNSLKYFMLGNKFWHSSQDFLHEFDVTHFFHLPCFWMQYWGCLCAPSCLVTFWLLGQGNTKSWKDGS